MPPVKSRLIIADDHEVVRQGLRDIVSRSADLEIIGEAGDGPEAERLARSQAAELLILDIALPLRRGIQILESLRHDGSALPVMFFSMYPASQYAEYARRNGAQGYVGKDAGSDRLLASIRHILAGGDFVLADGAALEAPLAHCFAELSPREIDVMRGLLDGASLLAIAGHLGISTKSVTTYRTRVLDKLGLKSNVELAMLAARQGFI